MNLENNCQLCQNRLEFIDEELHRLKQLVEPYRQEANFFKTKW
jgi:archaellum component FlaC